jgi:hypothetical protein
MYNKKPVSGSAKNGCGSVPAVTVRTLVPFIAVLSYFILRLTILDFFRQDQESELVSAF